MEASEKDKLRGIITKITKYLVDEDTWFVCSAYDESWYLEDCFFDEDEEDFTE